MSGTFSGMTVQLENTRAKLVFPAKQQGGQLRLSRNNSDRQHIHYDIEVHFILQGSYRLLTPQSEYTLEENSLCIIPKGCSHQVLPGLENSQSFNMLVTLHSKGKGVRAKTVTQLWNGVRELQVFPEQNRICEYVRQFHLASQKADDINRHIRDSLMTLIFCLVTEQLSQRFPNRSKMAGVCSLPNTGEWFDADLENFLMHNYRSKLSRETVARHIGISAAQLSRVIRKNYGTNYAGLMTSLRMADARKLLRTEKSIAEIAKLLGYTTYNGFAAAFKKYYKKTPEAMQKELQEP